MTRVGAIREAWRGVAAASWGRAWCRPTEGTTRWNLTESRVAKCLASRAMGSAEDWSWARRSGAAVTRSAQRAVATRVMTSTWRVRFIGETEREIIASPMSESSEACEADDNNTSARGRGFMRGLLEFELEMLKM